MFGVACMNNFMNGQNNSLKLRSVLEDPNSTVAEISEIVSGDSKLSAFVLQVVNHPFFGLGENIVDIEKAVNLLGIGQLEEMLFGELAMLPDEKSVVLPHLPVQNIFTMEQCLA
jgi:HD-like signal output (HDOD) protein